MQIAEIGAGAIHTALRTPVIGEDDDDAIKVASTTSETDFRACVCAHTDRLYGNRVAGGWYHTVYYLTADYSERIAIIRLHARASAGHIASPLSSVI